MKESNKKIFEIWEKILTVFTCCTFLVIFITFMTTIISRYCLKKPVTWSYEVSVLAYMWTMFFASGIALKYEEHVVFGLVYDKRSEKGKAIYRMIYNAMLIVLLAWSLPSGIRAIMKSQMITGVLKLPYKLVFAPYFFMMVDIIVRSILKFREAVIEFKNAPKAGGAK